VNGEAIYATRPWKFYGEGPSTVAAEKGQFDGQTDMQKKPFTTEDIRFTQSKDGKTLYTIVLSFSWRTGKVTIKSPRQQFSAMARRDWQCAVAGCLRQITIHPRRKRVASHAAGQKPGEIAFAFKD